MLPVLAVEFGIVKKALVKQRRLVQPASTEDQDLVEYDLQKMLVWAIASTWSRRLDRLLHQPFGWDTSTLWTSTSRSSFVQAGLWKRPVFSTCSLARPSTYDKDGT